MLPTVEEIRNYADGLSDWTDAQILEVLASETAHQSRRCSVPAIYPPDLAEALKFSVVESLGLRNSFSSNNAEEFENPSNARPAYRHPYVRRLEAPYRKVFFA